jgi:hypothetical protein
MFLSSGKCHTMPLKEDVNGIGYQNFLLKYGWWMTQKLGGFKCDVP